MKVEHVLFFVSIVNSPAFICVLVFSVYQTRNRATIYGYNLKAVYPISVCDVAYRRFLFPIACQVKVTPNQHWWLYLLLSFTRTFYLNKNAYMLWPNACAGPLGDDLFLTFSGITFQNSTKWIKMCLTESASSTPMEKRSQFIQMCPKCSQNALLICIMKFMIFVGFYLT